MPMRGMHLFSLVYFNSSYVLPGTFPVFSVDIIRDALGHCDTASTGDEPLSCISTVSYRTSSVVEIGGVCTCVRVCLPVSVSLGR